MCKIAIIPHVKPGLEKKAWKLAKALTPGLVEYDNDGFGYMAIGPKGLFGERWLNVKDSWKTRPVYSKPEINELERLTGIVDVPSPYNSFGTPNVMATSIALHSRKATCEISMDNVHPFVNESLSYGVIHNGVISNASDFKFRKITCDSEAILHSLIAANTADSFENLHLAIKNLEGWYAVAAYVKDRTGKYYLDIFKESSAGLDAAYIPELKTTVFCTNYSTLKKACESLGWKVGHRSVFLDNTSVRFDLSTGKAVAYMPITPVKASYAPLGKDYWDSRFPDENPDADLPPYDDVPSYREDYWGDRFRLERLLPKELSVTRMLKKPELNLPDEPSEAEVSDTYDHINKTIIAKS